MVDKQKLDKLDKIVRGSEHVVLLQADNPDLDSLGSSRALQLSIEALGITTTIVCPRRLKGANLELFGDYTTDEFPEEFDTVILTDTGSEHLISSANKSSPEKLEKKKFIIIDHHPEEADDFKFADLKIIDTNAPAAAEIVYKAARELGWPINREFAEAVLLAYMYDSRKFTIDKVSPETFKTAAELLDYGLNIADINYLYDQAYAIDSRTYKRKANLIRRVKFYRRDSIAVYSIGQRLRKWLKTRGSLSEYLKYELLNVRDVKISAGLTKLPDNKVLVTMRAHVPVAQKIAEEFGGGGHPQAAGCMMESASLRKARKQLVETANKYLDEYDNER